jgi:hypothetical protein
LGGNREIAKDFGVVNRIDAIETAGHDISASVATIACVFFSDCGSSDRNTECGDADQHECHSSNHGSLLSPAHHLLIEEITQLFPSTI